MMKTLKKAVAGFAALAFAVAAMPVMSTSAEAGHRHYRSHGYYHGGYKPYRHYRGHRYYGHRSYRKHRNRAVVAGIAGLAIGTIIGHAAAQPRYYRTYPSYSYRHTGYRPRPWTSEWYSYCSRKYRSFDARSGTFQPYHGRRKLCR